MAYTLEGRLSIGLNLKQRDSADSSLQAALNEINANFADWKITSGTTAGKADIVFADTRTLTASATEDLDLSGSLTMLLGASVFAKIKLLYVKAAAGNTNNVQVTRTATTGTVGPFMADGDGITLPPKGVLLVASEDTGWTVTNSSDDTLTFTNSAGGTSVTYTVIIVGCSA